MAVFQAFVGGWAAVAPRAFFDTFPGLGHHWTAMFPPYNEHLVRDFGGLNLGYGVLFAIAAARPDVRVVRGACAAYLCFAVPHLAFHLGHLDHMPTSDAVGQVVSLSIGVVLPLARGLLAGPAGRAGAAGTPEAERTVRRAPGFLSR
jgi:hypothetical protein